MVVGVLTYYGIMSAFAPLMFVLGPLSANLIARLVSLPLRGQWVGVSVSMQTVVVMVMFESVRKVILVSYPVSSTLFLPLSK